MGNDAYRRVQSASLTHSQLVATRKHGVAYLRVMTTPNDDAATPPASDPAPDAAPAATPPAPGDATPPEGEANEPPELDDATKKLIEEARLDASRKANAEAANVRKRLKAFEDAEEKRKLEALSETERLQKERDDATQAAEAAKETARVALLRADVAVEAAKLNIVDADAALKLLDQSGIEYGEDGSIFGVKDALDALLVAKPYLKAESKPGDPNLSPSNGGRGAEPQLTPQQQTEALFNSTPNGKRIWG